MDFDIRHIAKLARLKLDEGQVEKFTQQMSDIVDMVAQLPEIDDAAPELDHAHPMELRPDVVQPSLRREEILQNAPQVEAGCFVVPRVVE
jgi:aspartyl-tRNA(Asn)/glutamyl-tRNA(Gln) amidotransferase subunit C